jgi:predicted metalloprotease
MRRVAGLMLLLLALAGSGCGAKDQVEQAADEARQELRDQRDRLRAEVERLRARVEEVLGEIERAVPRAQRTSPQTESRGRTEGGTIDGFLTDVIESVDRYWTRTLAASELPEPRVSYVWVPPGQAVATGCQAPADDGAAFYCPADDTIYISQRFAAAVYEGALRGLPGERAGGRAVGDFGVAYIVAHEYAHNLQQELGIFSRRFATSKPFELQADCMAGAWGSSVFAEGGLQPGDIEEAVGTALAVGDFDLQSAGHHGTPEERRAAWLTGFESADPSSCAQYVPAT